MSDHRAKLQALLCELFQFDAADLDFGIYRIMNQRRVEIDAFIQTGLLDAVAQEFQVLDVDAIKVQQTELDRVAAEVRKAYGKDAIDVEGDFALQQFAQLPLALQYTAAKAEITEAAGSIEAEKDIFNALYTFFSRYYDGGDFLTKRRYSRTEKYVIPYNGEEVYFHWANRDQYYVKTADVLTDYAFRIESHGGYRVCFKLAAANTEQNNVKGEKRFFFPLKQDVAQYDANRRELMFSFEYRPLTEEETEVYGKNGAQAKILESSRGRLLHAVPDTTLRGLLATPPTADDDRTLLDLHLYRWTRKSTSDFFIHKDLRGFLERELDFYLKNEILRLDDLDITNATRAASYLTRLAVVKSTGQRIIDFLAQIEDFQRRLFERPKFVLASEWCVTLDRVPKSLYPAILANDAQWQEWQNLFGVEKPRSNGKRAQAFLVEHPTLTIDTALYDAAFKDQLLSTLSDTEGGLAAQMDGLLIHSENFQALKFLQPAYRDRVKCIYIDPPYNTGTDGFVYKDNYQHSTWLTMMEDRLRLAYHILASNGVIFASIDDYEVHRLRHLLAEIFIGEQFIGTFVRKRRASSAMSQNLISQDHEYVLTCARSEFKSFRGVDKDYAAYGNPDNDPNGDWTLGDLTVGMGKDLRPGQYYTLVNPKTGKQYPANPNRVWAFAPETMDQEIAAGRVVFPDDPVLIKIGKNLSRPMVKRYRDRLKSTVNPLSTWVEARKELDDTNGEVASISSGLNTESTKELQALFSLSIFNYAKPVSFIKNLVDQVLVPGDIGCDFFAGSGTTAHAIINLNHEDGGNRKYILVEQDAYFDTVLKPRIQKVVYASEWKDGQPVEGARVGANGGSPTSHAFQYLRLESYEDTLDNLDLATGTAPAPGLFLPEHDDYLLKYMLDHETRGTRLNVQAFATPFDYEIRVRRDGVQKRVKVDLVETANYLLGLTVTARRTYTHQNRTYRVVFGTQGQESVAVIWRNTAGLDLRQEAEFVSQTFEVRLRETSKVYVNGESHIPNAQPIEDVFMNMMRGESSHA